MPKSSMSFMLEFHGTITPDLRKFLRQRRNTLGVTLQQLGKVLRVNWSTLRKWEDGTTARCRQHHIGRLARFIAGEYDDMLRKMNFPEEWHSRNENRNRIAVIRLLERLYAIYCLCEKYPDLGEGLLRDFQNALDLETQRLVNSSSANSLERGCIATKWEEKE